MLFVGEVLFLNPAKLVVVSQSGLSVCLSVCMSHPVKAKRSKIEAIAPKQKMIINVNNVSVNNVNNVNIINVNNVNVNNVNANVNVNSIFNLKFHFNFNFN